MPKAYLIGHINVTDLGAYHARYAATVPATIAKFGGKYLVRGGEVTALEGEMPFPRTVVLEFPDKAHALEWYHSPDYQSIIGGRHDNSTGVLSLIEGV